MKLFAVTSALVGVAFLTSVPEVAAQEPKGLQKWDYATLTYMETDGSSFAAWISPKARFTAKSKAKHHESLSKIHKDLGGKEDVGIFDVCILLSRIGQDGWELAAHTLSLNEGARTFIWTFKRPVTEEKKTK